VLNRSGLTGLAQPSDTALAQAGAAFTPLQRPKRLRAGRFTRVTALDIAWA